MQNCNKCLSQRDAWKNLKLPKIGKGCLKLSFYGSHIDGIVCVKQIDLGSAMALIKYYFFFMKMSSDIDFYVAS